MPDLFKSFDEEIMSLSDAINSMVIDESIKIANKEICNKIKSKSNEIKNNKDVSEEDINFFTESFSQLNIDYETDNKSFVKEYEKLRKIFHILFEIRSHRILQKETMVVPFPFLECN